MQVLIKFGVAVAVTALTGVAAAQTTTGEAANAIGRAASAAVTPGDQNMGRNPDNRSGGLMGNPTGAATSAGRAASAAVTPGDQDMGRNPNNRSGGLMGNDPARSGSAAGDVGRPARAPRSDRS